MDRKKFASLVALAALVFSTALFTPVTASAGGSGFFTSERSYVVPLENGVTIQPLLTAGDIIGTNTGGYQMSGIPDGIGAYRSSSQTIELFMNHELALADDDPSDSRISHLTLNNNSGVVAASYPIDGSEGFEEFCSSTLAFIRGEPWYFTGEEAPQSARQGSSIAMNAQSERYVETPYFGHMYHENNVPVKGLAKAFIGIAEDGNAGRSQLYAYTADRFIEAIRGHGKLRAFVPDEPVADGNPSPNDLAEGETMGGTFEGISQGKNRDPKTLEAFSQKMGAFDFVRIEDMVADPYHPGVVYFADTGAANRETIQGRIYKLELDPAHPSHGVISVVLDADAGADMASPDNLGISENVLVIQEDRNWKKSGYNRVLVYAFDDGSLTAVARTDPPQSVIDAEGVGDWESSGVVDASEFFGSGWWFLDVQANDFKVKVPGPGLQVDSAKGEGGQLLRIYIPGT